MKNVFYVLVENLNIFNNTHNIVLTDLTSVNTDNIHLTHKKPSITKRKSFEENSTENAFQPTTSDGNINTITQIAK